MHRRPHTRHAAHRSFPRRLAVTTTTLLAVALAAGLGAWAEEPDAGADEAGSRPARSTDYYFGVFTAGSWASADLERSGFPATTEEDHSFFWGASLGLERHFFGPFRIRLELEGTNERKYTVAFPGGAAGDDVELQDWTMQGNFWIVYPLSRIFPDTPVIRRISPFGGGGVGFSRSTVDVNAAAFGGREKSVRFAWQGGVGASYEVTRWLSVDLRYQYVDLGKTTTTVDDTGGNPVGDIVIDLGANELLGGIRFVF